MARTPARRWGPGTSAIVRSLVAADQPLSQVHIAELVGVSQPRVSQVLARLATSNAVSASDLGYEGDKPRLVDLYRDNHRPAVSGAESAWYSLDPTRNQTEKLIERAQTTATRVAISADLGPDLLTPWRHPTLTVVYADKPLDLAAAGFVPAEGRVDATVLIRHTTDTTLLAAFEPWPRSVDGIPLTDPVQQIWDLYDLGGEDRSEAAGRLLAALINGAVRRLA